MSDKVYILEVDRAKAEFLARGADEIGDFARRTLAQIETLEQALGEAVDFIKDLIVLLCPPQDTVTTYYHGGVPLSREESVMYTVDGARQFLSGIQTVERDRQESGTIEPYRDSAREIPSKPTNGKS